MKGGAGGNGTCSWGAIINETYIPQ